jgi:hypothetical protein
MSKLQAVEELDRSGLSGTRLIVGRNNPRHRGLQRRALVRIEESFLPAPARLRLCHR